MAKTRVFISSTYYDLKHVRSSLENFVDSLGFEAILSEKGDIAFTPEVPPSESCYREVGNADIFVLLVGGRYGSERSGSEKLPKDFFTRYDSITKEEYKNAVKQNIPIYILVEKSVNAEYQTFLQNLDNTKMRYAHVDSVNVFYLIQEIFSQPCNNPVHYFDSYSEIEGWLRDQWSGLFKELLKRRSNQQQLASLSTQVAELGELNKTLKRYLEKVVSEVIPKEESASLIKSEDKRLEYSAQIAILKRNSLMETMHSIFNIKYEHLYDSISKAQKAEDFLAQLKSFGGDKGASELREALNRYDYVRADLQSARLSLELPPFPDIEKSYIERSSVPPVHQPTSKPLARKRHRLTTKTLL